MKKGKVRWFDEESGKGMIRCDETRESYFVHYSAIDSSDKFKELSKNAPVVFSLSHYKAETVTYNGTPESLDQVQVSYVKEI